MKPNSTLVSGKFYYFPFVLCLLLFSAVAAVAQPTSQTFNSSGSYVIPPGFSANVTIQAWGAGGGGGINASGAKGGGGSGAFASSTVTLSAGSYAITVGSGGSAGTGGGNSSFTSIVVAAGGGSTVNATGGAGGTIAASTGVTRIAGTNGSTGPGNSGGAGAAGANGGGSGGNGGPANNGSGNSGNMPGGGGGGKAGPGAGGLSGVGGGGRVIVTVNTVLPVRLSSIKAFEKQNSIQIEWIAAAEYNLDKYEIERSADGISYTRIGDLAARNSFSETKYTFTDLTPLAINNFYRLRIVNLDGAIELSSVVKINLDKRIKDVKLYPNPVTNGYVAIQASDLNKGDYTAKVFNAAGQQIHVMRFTHTGGAINQTLQLPETLKTGVYLLEVSKSGAEAFKKSFVIQ